MAILSVEPFEKYKGMEVRLEDEEECSLGGLTPEAAVKLCSAACEQNFCVLANGEAVAVYGISKTGTFLGKACRVWLLTGVRVEDHKVAFGRLTRRVLADIQQQYPVVRVAVAPGYFMARDWLAWLGFEYVGIEGPFFIYDARGK